MGHGKNIGENKANNIRQNRLEVVLKPQSELFFTELFQLIYNDIVFRPCFLLLISTKK